MAADGWHRCRGPSAHQPARRPPVTLSWAVPRSHGAGITRRPLQPSGRSRSGRQDMRGSGRTRSRTRRASPMGRVATPLLERLRPLPDIGAPHYTLDYDEPDEPDRRGDSGTMNLIW